MAGDGVLEGAADTCCSAPKRSGVRQDCGESLRGVECSARSDAAAFEYRGEWRDHIVDGGRLENPADSGFDLVRRADPRVQPEWFRYLIGKVATYGSSGDSAYDLADQKPVGQGVVPVLRPRLPQRRLRLNGADNWIPRTDVVDGQGTIDSGYSSLMGQQPPNSGGLLSCLPELRPVISD